jgi:hypothetical protein
MSETGEKRARGRPRKAEGERRGPNITFRTPGGLRTKLENAASHSGWSISEEVVFRLNRDFGWEESKKNIDRTLEEAAAYRDESFLQALRAAGMQLVREADGATTVNVNLEHMRAAAQGILQFGFISTDDQQAWLAGADRHTLPGTFSHPDTTAIKQAVLEALKEAGLYRGA